MSFEMDAIKSSQSRQTLLEHHPDAPPERASRHIGRRKHPLLHKMCLHLADEASAPIERGKKIAKRVAERSHQAKNGLPQLGEPKVRLNSVSSFKVISCTFQALSLYYT
ncbi:hypothetical protein KIN20_022303 [Parelaphostrongylus tenuis]|uniref:Uncharacterized protein n=1 Tax=Parelaphostrongylus tenuis TaxID=148309 RepID=A0AAD5N618_PARTN|nr:hypothetical protein KIN20_022303 [Parelaphostrongylus tenuis]